MGLTRIVLLIINLLGGLAVLGSYVWGLKTHTGGADVLWGGASPRIRPAYGVSMILSAVSYFAFIFFILFKLDPAVVSVNDKLGYSFFSFLFIIILGASSLWMPLTYAWVGQHLSLIWLAIRAVLLMVGLSSCVLAWALLNLNTGTGGVAYWLAVAGSIYFAFHTTILDALLWPALYR